MPWNRWLQAFLLVLGVLLAIALILPAVQQAREAARRTQWRNNYKQLGLAFHNYHNTFQQFPFGGTFAADGTPHHGWTSALIPYLEATPWYNGLNFQLPWDDPRQIEHFLVFRHGYSPYGDPSVTTPLMRLDGLSNTHCSVNSWLLHRNFGATIPQITIGTSQTMLVGDARGHYWPFGHPANWRDISVPLNSSLDEFGHPSREVVHLLFADGSVHVVSPDIDQTALVAMAGPESLRPTSEQVAHLQWPYELPSGGYWRTEAIGHVDIDGVRAFGFQLRRDSSGTVREAKSSEYEKGWLRRTILEEQTQKELDGTSARLADYPTLNRVELRHGVSDQVLARLAVLPELHSVELRGKQISDLSFQYLAEFPALEDLELSVPTLTDEGLQTTRGFSHLRRLALQIDDDASFTPRGVIAFWTNHPHITIKIFSIGQRGERGTYWHTWTRCEIESLAAHNVSFGDPDVVSSYFDCPCDALRPANGPWRYDW